ncbi:MAG TPA: universal stress protein [Ktedonobacteraceae bacterium]|jgi:nucleotide-binding universal stress UspA family protein
MFQHILVPLDGSSRAEQALPVAARLARSSGGTITLFTVVGMAPEAMSYRLAGPFLPQHVFQQDLARAHSYLDQIALRSDLAGLTLVKQVDLGDPAATILSYAEQLAVDLIVLSSHGYTGMRRWILGSVAENIARHAPAPVFILREGEPLRTHLRFDGMCAVRALVPLDTSVRSQDAIPPAAALVAALSSPQHGQLQLTRIVILPESMQDAEKSEFICQARLSLEATGQCIRDGLVANVGPELHLLLSWIVSSDSDIAEGIVRLAESGERAAATAGARRCDLIAMTTHGISGMRRRAIGSITERVLHATTLPLLIVRPADMIEKERRQREQRVVATK